MTSAKLIEDTYLINLNSKYGTQKNGSKLSNVKFSNPNYLQEDYQYAMIGVESAYFFNSFNLIDSNNNVLNYSVNSINFSITVAEGNYNLNSFVTELKAKFQANGHTFTITFNTQNGILTFSNAVLFSFLTSSTIKAVIGFSGTTTNGLVLACPFKLNILGNHNRLKIICPTFSLRNYDYNINGMVAIINNDVASGEVVYYQNKANTAFLLQSNTIEAIEIMIIDENDNLVDFKNQNWGITFKLSLFREMDFTRRTLDDLLQQPVEIMEPE